MAGLLDSAGDFERWLADIEKQRPISHPNRLDPRVMYQVWLQQKLQEDQQMMQFMRQPAPYEKAQLPSAQLPGALSELSALSPSLPAAPLTLQDPATLRSPPPPARPSLPNSFGSRLRGPGSANIVDERTPMSADDVSNWLRNTRPPGDIDWKF